MNDWLAILTRLGIQIAPWVLVIVLILYIFRARLNQTLNALLDWLGTIFRGAWSYRRFERLYRPAIRAMHLYMRVVGIRFEKGRESTIPEAYVPLRLAPYASENASYADRRDEEYIGSIQVGQPLVGEAQARGELRPIEDILQRHSALVVLGDPGAGKSTLLKYLVTRLTEPGERERARKLPSHRMVAFKRARRSRPTIPCPLYVPLRSCRVQNDTLLKDILDPETKILNGMLPSNLLRKMPPDFIERCMRKGRAILLLDGLDEVANEEMYADVVRKINDFYLSYPGNHLVVTCRVAGWRSGLRPDFALYQALPLDRQQQHNFIARWYQTAYKQNDNDETAALLEEERSAGSELLRHERELGAHEEAEALERLLRDRAQLAELAANPMLLSLICLVYHLRRDLPRGRAALYEECVQILLGVWDSTDKGLQITKPTMDEKRKILRHVAYRLHTSGEKDISRRDFVRLVIDDLGVSEEEARVIVRQIEVRSWLIVERVIDRFAFSHLTLQEFFVVEYLRTEKQDIIDFEEIKDWNIWHEPVLLMCGKSTDPTTFIERVATHNAVLSLFCISEADSTLLDIQRTSRLIDSTLKQVSEGELALIELIPAMVSLLDIDKSPFASQVMNFVETYFQTLDKTGRSDLVMSIAKCGTREAARLLLYVYQTKQDEWLSMLDGLLLIGGAAVGEALSWNRRGGLRDGELFQLLLRIHSPEATQVLWERYGLEPREVTDVARIAWAESWARRLAFPENDLLMRSIPYNGPIDAEIWPYRKSQHTALAAIVQKCVQTLGAKKGYSAHYDEPNDQFDLRVQLHLLFESQVYRISKDGWYALIAAGGREEMRTSGVG